MNKIPLMIPQIPNHNEWARLLDSAKESGQWSNFGAIHNQAQRELSKITGKAALPVTNGTVAVEIAAKIAFDPGMRVAVPDFTCAATALAIIAAGCEPVIFPCDPKTWTISLDALAEYKEEYDAICVVSPFGYRVDFNSYEALAENLNKPMIYDLAGAWGMPMRTDRPCAMSFHATKNMCIGEGGAVFFSDMNQLEMAHRLIVFGFNEERETQYPQAINGKLDEIRSAVLLSQLSPDNHFKIKKRVSHKKALCAAYEKGLGEKHAHGLYRGGSPSLCVFSGFDVPALEQMGEQEGIQFKGYYRPLIGDMHGFSSYKRVGDGDLNAVFKTCVAFPSDASYEQVHLVLEVARRCSI